MPLTCNQQFNNTHPSQAQKKNLQKIHILSHSNDLILTAVVSYSFYTIKSVILRIEFKGFSKFTVM